MMKLEELQISEELSLKQALQQIEVNKLGVVCVSNQKHKIIGIVTDGDIRRALLQGYNIDDKVKVCANYNFVWADESTPREILLKQLDQKIICIPVLDSQGKLLNLVHKKSLPIIEESPVYARARAPVRVSFGGGGSDLTYYFAEEGGAVINSTVGIYSHATLLKRSDRRIKIKSMDLNDNLDVRNFDALPSEAGAFSLIIDLLRVIQPDFGFELYLHSDFPMKSGLGGSAVISSAILGCFNQFRQDRWDRHEIAELAFQAERLYMGVKGGWQDQYASVFGGFNFMEFRMEQNVVHPLRIHSDTILELEECLLLCDSGGGHESGVIHEDQQQQVSNEDIRSKVKQNVKLTYDMRNNLLRGRLNEFGNNLNQAWQLKKNFSEKISNQELDHIYDTAIENGAIGGKLMGAGGGGFFLFFVPAFKKLDLMSALNEKGLKTQQFRFEQEGMKSWTVRI